MRPFSSTLVVLGLGALAAACGHHADRTEAREEAAAAAEAEIMSSKTGLYALQANSLEGEAVDLGDYAGGVALVVNLASK